MKRKYIFGIIALAMVAVLGISMVSAFGFGGFIDTEDMENKNKTEMQEQMKAMQDAIESGDYESWKSLMEEKIASMQEQITEENFNELAEKNKEMKEKQEEMQGKMEKFCEENDCSGFEKGESPEFKDSGMINRFFHMPLSEDDSD